MGPEVCVPPVPPPLPGRTQTSQSRPVVIVQQPGGQKFAYDVALVSASELSRKEQKHVTAALSRGNSAGRIISKDKGDIMPTGGSSGSGDDIYSGLPSKRGTTANSCFGGPKRAGALVLFSIFGLRLGRGPFHAPVHFWEV